MQIKSRPLGKAVTNLQFATILAALVLVIFPHLTRRPVEWLSILTLVISVFSIMDYVYTYLRGGIDRR